MPSKVPFQVVYSSSSDDNHREKELEVINLHIIVNDTTAVNAAVKVISPK